MTFANGTARSKRAREPLQLTAADRLKLAAGILPDAIVELQSQAEAGRLMKKDRDEANATKAKMARERDEAKRQAGLVRTLPLDRVMKVLGGEQDPDDPLKWNLPSLGATTIDKAKPHRFFSERANGGGAIDLVKAETGWDFDQAVRFLGTEFTATAVAADAAHMAALTVGDDVRQKLTDKEAPLRLEDRAPAAAEADWSAVDKGAGRGRDRRRNHPKRNRHWRPGGHAPRRTHHVSMDPALTTPVSAVGFQLAGDQRRFHG